MQSLASLHTTKALTSPKPANKAARDSIANHSYGLIDGAWLLVPDEYLHPYTSGHLPELSDDGIRRTWAKIIFLKTSHKGFESVSTS